GGAHDGGTSVTIVVLHPLTTFSFPRNEAVVVFEAGHESIVKLPIVPEVISSSGGGDSIRIVDAQCPSAHVDFVSSVVQRLASAVRTKPMPIVRMHIVGVRMARGWPLPEIPVQARRHRNLLAVSD